MPAKGPRTTTGNQPRGNDMKIMTFPHADVSTRHISRADAERLDELALELLHGGTAPVTVAKYPEGYFLSVPDELSWDDEDFKRQMGVSDALMGLMICLSEEGVYILRLDADGIRNDDLPKFDW